MSTVIAGGTGTGKTSILNALSQAIAPHCRVVCIEDTRELNIRVEDVVYVTTGSQNPDTASRIYTMRDMLANALRQRPDHIIIGEARDAVAWEAIKATNTGHRGVMLTLHSEDDIGVVSRLIQLAREAPEASHLPEHVIMQNVVSGFNFNIYLRRFQTPNGVKRTVYSINEWCGVTESRPVINTLFSYDHQKGALVRTMIRPNRRTYMLFEEMGFSGEFVDKVLAHKADDYYKEVLAENGIQC